MGWFKNYLKGQIEDLTKSDADLLPEMPEDVSADQDIGRKAIIEDPFFQQTGQQVIFKHKASKLSNKTLKDVSLRDWLVSGIIQNRCDTMANFSRPQKKRFETSFHVCKKNPDEDVNKDELVEMKMLEDFIYNCGRTDNTPKDDRMLFGDFLKLATRDVLTFGHVAVEKVKTRGKALHRFRPLPAEQVYLVDKKASKELINKQIIAANKALKPTNNDPRKDQKVNNMPIEYYKYIQMSYDNRTLAVFGDEDMVFKLFNPQNFADSMGYCYLPKTAHVTLADGSVKLVENLEVGDEVLSHDGSTNKVLEKKSRFVDEEVYKISPNGLGSHHVTGEHPLYIVRRSARRSWEHKNKKGIKTNLEPSWVSAKDIRERDYVAIPKVKYEVNFKTLDMSNYGHLDKHGFVVANPKQNCPQHKINRYIEVDSDFGWLLGLYLGDGCTYSDGNTVRFDLGIHETDIQDRLSDILMKKFNIKCKIRSESKRGYTGIYVNSKVFSAMIKDLCPGNSYTKSVNEKVLYSSHGTRIGVIAGHIDSDGTIYSNGDGCANSKSLNLVNALSLMTNSVGTLAKIKHYNHKNGFDSKEGYETTYRIQYPRHFIRDLLTSEKSRNISGTTFKKHYREDDKAFYVSISKIEKKHYKGKVHNIEVENTHSYLVNQSATHNCYSPLELAIINITTHLNVENYNSNFFTHGYAARGILHLQGTVTQSQLTAFRRQFYSTISGAQHAWRTPIISGLEGVEWVPMSGTAKEMEYINFNSHVMRSICSQFQIDPMELGLDYLVSASGKPAAGADNETKIELSRERGLRPLLMFFEDFINHNIIPAIDPTFTDKYEFKFLGYTSETPQTAIALQQAEMTVHSSMNDLLRQAKKEKLDVAGADLPLNQAFWAVIEKNYTKGEIREIFFGDKDASKKRELQYIPGDPAYMGWQQLLLTMDRQKIQDKQMKEQMEAQAQAQQEESERTSSQEQREQEQHDHAMADARAQAAGAVTKKSLKEQAKETGATSANYIDGKPTKNPINVES